MISYHEKIGTHLSKDSNFKKCGRSGRLEFSFTLLKNTKKFEFCKFIEKLKYSTTRDL